MTANTDKAVREAAARVEAAFSSNAETPRPARVVALTERVEHALIGGLAVVGDSIAPYRVREVFSNGGAIVERVRPDGSGACGLTAQARGTFTPP